MHPETLKLIDKLNWIYRVIDTAYLFRNEDVNDFSKRVILRIIFVQVVNLLKIIGNIKNNLYREGLINQIERKQLEENIKILKKSYENSFDIVRDKLTAHGQPVDLIELVDWWQAIDYTTIEIIYHDSKTVQSDLKEIKDVKLLTIPDYFPIKIPSTSILSKSNNKAKMSADRLGLAKSNTIALIACHETQEKAQLIVSVISFLENNFELTRLLNNPEGIFKTILFDIGWMLVIIDLISLIDNMFEETAHDKSLLAYWKNDMDGYEYLISVNKQRNHEFETSIRAIRNTFCAHIDSKKSIKDLYSNFYSLDLSQIATYTVFLINGFYTACRKDVRTGTFLMNNMDIGGYEDIKISSRTKPFDK